MKSVLVLNCGSSSIKFAVIEAESSSTIISGLAERLGNIGASLVIKYKDNKESHDISNYNHDNALDFIVKQISKIKQYEIIVVGHRVVHGGELFAKSCLVDIATLSAIKECNDLAPLHNPANISGIIAAQKAYPKLPQVAVFDTAFHQTIPEKNYLYAINYDYYKSYGIRRYGFHGTSYRYIKEAIPYYNNDRLPKKLIVAHLGNGASVCAIKDGKSIATSMGLTPLDGLVQGTRSGLIDPAIISFLSNKTKKKESKITDELWKDSGLLGLSNLTNDCRELEYKAHQGDKNCKRALDVFVVRLQEFIGSYASVMNGVDGIVFTGGIGENSSYIREKTLLNLSYLGFDISEEENNIKIKGEAGNIAKLDSKPVWVIPTNEEIMITRDSLEIIDFNFSK